MSDQTVRLWSLHPAHLDRQGLIALWREALLAQAVLAGRTRGYRHHPQLERFRESPSPGGALAAYLDVVREEATARGYRFDPGRVDEVERWDGTIEVSSGQLAVEREHLLAKLHARSPEEHAAQQDEPVRPHPLFAVVEGPVASWERVVVVPAYPADEAARD